MKIFYFIILVLSPLLAEVEPESCYTVQLLSSSARNSINMSKYPLECKLITIRKTSTVRCGCYDKRSDAQTILDDLKEDYSQAFITRTYKYRFGKQTLQGKSVKNDDDELRLILQVFLYKGDLESAYKVANLGYSKYPSSYYWNQKMAEICKWTNRSARATKHLRFIYSKKYDPKIEDELINYGTATYQYEDIEDLVVNKARRNPTEDNINLMILTYKKIGEPEKVVKILEDEYYKDRNNTMLLTKALRLSLEIGDLSLAKKYVDIVEANKPYSQKDGVLVANYYYIRHDVSKAYKSLLYVDNFNITNKLNNINYYELKSDLGWYLQDNLNSALASRKLIELQSARLVDYERIIFVYKKRDPKLAMKMQREAYLKYKISYLFYAYSEDALINKEYKNLFTLTQMIEDQGLALIDDPKFWIVKAKLYTKSKKFDLAKKMLDKAYKMSADDNSIKLLFINYYINTNNHKGLELVLLDMDKNKDLDSSFFFPMASAYFYLNNINMASYYTNKLIVLKDATTTLISFKFLQAYIYQAKNNHSGFISLMEDIVSTLKKDAKFNPNLWKQNIFLSNYLRAAMYILDAKKFTKKLKNAKKYLTKENYQDISYSWAVKNGSYEKSLKIFHKIKKKALWLQFSNSLVFKDHSKIENLLREDLDSLSISDASLAANTDGQQALSQTLAFKGLAKNSNNQNAYIQHLDLSKERTDSLDIQFSQNDREPLSQKYIKINNSIYLSRGYFFEIGAKYNQNRLLDNTLINVPKESSSANIALKREFNKGYFRVDVGFVNAMKDYTRFELLAHYRLSTDLLTDIKIDKNIEATEGNQILLGGKKDKLSLNLTWSILNSTAVNFIYERARYSSQDEVYIGSGNYARVAINYQIRNGYPDMKIGTSYDVGSYDEVVDSRGIVDSLSVEKSAVLPSDSYNIGINFSYGMANSENYTRVWRPYLELNPSYNSITKAYSYGYRVGYGGKIFYQDHLSFGVIYTQSTISQEKPIYEFFINYKFIYTHPKI